MKKLELELENAQKLESDADRKKAANDQMESCEYLPGQEEMTKLSEKKEEKATEIGELHSEMVAAQSWGKEEIAVISKTKKETSEKLSSLKDELEGRRVKKSNLLCSKTEQREHLEREITDCT